MIRVGTIDDCYDVYLLICEMENCKLDYAVFKNIYQKMVNSDFYMIIVAVEDNKVIGEITLRFENQLHHCASIVEIMECAVNAEYRSRGIGSLLFENACRVARDKNCIQIEVTSNKSRLRAHKFYERVGMRNTHYKFCKLI